MRNSRNIRLDAVTREFLELGFQTEFFEAAVAFDQHNIECLVQLGDLYSRQGNHESGLEIDRRLTKLCPEEPTFYYNLACTYSVLGRCHESAEAVLVAIDLGYEDFEYLQRDEDLTNLRNTSEYQTLVKPMLKFASQEGDR